MPWILPRAAQAARERVKRVEGTRVDGRHPGSIKPSSLTRWRWRRAWRLEPRRVRKRPLDATELGREAGAARGGSRQRVSEAESHARITVENTVTGSVCRRGCRSQLRQDREAPCSRGIRVTGHVEGVATEPKLEGRRQAKLHPVSGNRWVQRVLVS
jgi:hypothetical protein